VHVTDYRLRTLAVPLDPPISDSQTDDTRAGIVALELEADTGAVGLGLGGVDPDRSPATVRRAFETAWEAVADESPHHLLGRMRRPRGGEYPPAHHGGFERVVDVALWDLAGKDLDAPLYELFGGDDPRVPAYASGLLFSVDDDAVRRRYSGYAGAGFDAAKVKVGYPTVEADVDRIELVRDAMGGDVTIALDANEAFSPKEAVRRAHAYRDAGIDVLWLEDPCHRRDVDGIARVAEQVPFSHVNTGEYVPLEGKRELLENAACDVLNLRNGMFSGSLDAAVLARAYGVGTHVGHVPGHVGVHLAAAVPEHVMIEWWDRPWDDLTDDSVTVEDGHLVAPDRPGHGVTLRDDAVEEYGRTE
jgi:L-alanine-DL-glutamate epimerase-like enolase superfamily enzyme